MSVSVSATFSLCLYLSRPPYLCLLVSFSLSLSVCLYYSFFLLSASFCVLFGFVSLSLFPSLLFFRCFFISLLLTSLLIVDLSLSLFVVGLSLKTLSFSFNFLSGSLFFSFSLFLFLYLSVFHSITHVKQVPKLWYLFSKVYTVIIYIYNI